MKGSGLEGRNRNGPCFRREGVVVKARRMRRGEDEEEGEEGLQVRRRRWGLQMEDVEKGIGGAITGQQI